MVGGGLLHQKQTNKSFGSIIVRTVSKCGRSSKSSESSSTVVLLDA